MFWQWRKHPRAVEFSGAGWWLWRFDEREAFRRENLMSVTLPGGFDSEARAESDLGRICVPNGNADAVSVIGMEDDLP